MKTQKMIHLSLSLIAASSLVAIHSASAGTIGVDQTANAGAFTLGAGDNTVALSGFSIDYLIVAGGGGGGGTNGVAARSGGGGAGGVLQGTSLSITNSQTITVGAGGASVGRTQRGNSGGNSTAFGLTAIGGGGGGGSSSGLGRNGGSGGGAFGLNTTVASGMAGQGNNGGVSIGFDTGGGGGGGGGAGSSSAGGIGLTSSITGFSITYAAGGGVVTANGQIGVSGAANTGNGGSGNSNNASSTTGGSGIVVVSYDNSYAELAGGTYTTSGGMGINKFQAGGNLELKSATISGDIGGSGNLVWDKIGTLTLSGTNGYTGATTLSSGTLALTPTGSISSSSQITVNSGATFNVAAVSGGFTVASSQTLGGSGTVTGPVTLSGTLAPGGPVGTLSFGSGLDLSPATDNTGKLAFQLDSIAASDKATVTGTLTIGSGLLGFSDFSFTSLGGLENGTYMLITSGTLDGTLDPANLSGSIGVATGTLQVDGTAIKLVVTGAGSLFVTWINGGTFANPGLLPDAASKLPGADPDGDGVNNAAEFAHDGDPTDPANNGKVLLVIADGDDSPDTQQELILTMAVRIGAGEAFSGASSQSATRDGVTYTVEGSLNLTAFDETINNQSAAVAPAGGFPSLGSGYQWKSFSLSGSNGLSNRGFLRSKAEMP